MSAAVQTKTRLVRSRGIGYAVAEFSHSCLVRLIDYPNLPLRTNTRETIKAGRTALLVRTELPLKERRIAVAYKRIRRKNFRKVLSALFRTNRTLRTWRLGHLFLERGIATSRPLAAVIPRAYRFGDDSYLVTEWIDGALNLHHYLEWVSQLAPADQIPRLQNLAEKLGDLLGRMHARGIGHRDLKPGNLLVVDRGQEPAVYIIDLDGACAKSYLSRTRRLKDLARLVVGVDAFACLGNSTRLRFLKAYLYATRDPFGDPKEYWRELATLSETLRHKKRERKLRTRR